MSYPAKIDYKGKRVIIDDQTTTEDLAKLWQEAFDKAEMPLEVITEDAPNEITLDLDEVPKHRPPPFPDCKTWKTGFEIIAGHYWRSKSARWHMKLELNKPIEPAFRPMLAVMLGSDPIREKLSYERALRGQKNPYILFRPKGNSKYSIWDLAKCGWCARSGHFQNKCPNRCQPKYVQNIGAVGGSVVMAGGDIINGHIGIGVRRTTVEDTLSGRELQSLDDE